jgi:hypothetical protein
VGKIYVVYRAVEIVFAAQIPLAQGTAEENEDRWLVECRETFDAIAEPGCNQRCIIGKP